MDKFSDYCFRDSFEHSSSESQLIDNYRGYEGKNPSHRSSRSQTPLSHSQMDGRLCLQTTAVTNKQRNAHKYFKFNIFKTFLPVLFIIVVIMSILTVVVLESDSEMFGSLKNIPEIVALKHQLYQPTKQYLKDKYEELFKKT